MSGQGEAHKQPIVDDQSDFIDVKVINQVNNEVKFRIKKSKKFERLMHAYCAKHYLEFNSVRFSFDGKRIREHDTPEMIQMEDGDVIDAMMDQTGGA